METFSALLAICEGNPPVTVFPSQRPVMRSFDVLLDLRLHKRLSKARRRWFETPSRLLWRHSNVGIIEEWYLDENEKFKLLNNAYEHTTEHYSTIDLTFASDALSSKCAWQVYYDINSDIHYGIEITLGLRNYCSESDFIPRYELDEADWDAFSIALDNTFHNFDTNNIHTLPANYIATIINDHFIKAADETIGKTKFSKTPWRCWYWNDDCTEYRRLYRQALSKFNDKRYPRRETRPIMKAESSQSRPERNIWISLTGGLGKNS